MKIDEFDFQIMVMGYVRYALAKDKAEFESVKDLIKRYRHHLEESDVLDIIRDIENSPFGYADDETQKRWYAFKAHLEKSLDTKAAPELVRKIGVLKSLWANS